MDVTVRVRGGQTASFDVIQQRHDEFVLALCPGVAESHRGDFVEIVLVLFAKHKHLRLDASVGGSFSICIFLEKITENVYLVLHQKQYEQVRPTQEDCSG